MEKAHEKEFHRAMVGIYDKAKHECGYHASHFLQMLSKYGGLETARRLLRTKDVQYGFTELWQCGRLDLTVEAHVLKPEFADLFTMEERQEAESRLKEHGYKILRA